ncbi:MAG: rRNA maturation RNase YbeY [Parcubacteria group bacterium CG10_big_fil_rev_8_21_14_0_10_38_31]|nr:MAG: rRNA maturation RNase YbeY [Parcubacteria group bacterium CG10_big_fil_rev_8_21_14_0_10_38_31]
MIEFTNLTKKRQPSLPWKKIKDTILGKRYNLSVVFSGNALTKKLNKKYRNKDKPANVLSFPFSSKEGEIFINLSYPHKLTSKNDIIKEKDLDRILHLFIHSLLHLKGFSHGDKMDDEEDKMIKKFK